MFRIKKRSRIAFILIMVLAPWVIDQFPDYSHYLDVLVFAGIYALVTIGLSLLMGYAGQISLGHAAFFGIGAYASGIMTTKFGLNPWFCMLVGMGICLVVAWLIGTPSLKLSGHYLAMATLAFGIIVYIVFTQETALTGGPDGMGGIPGIRILDFAFDTVLSYYYLVWFFVVLAFLFSVNLIQGRVGRALRAIHTSEKGADSMGVEVAQYKIQIFVFSSLLASLAGSFYAHYINFINPASFDVIFSVKLLIMIVTGGMHSIWGAVLGAILIAFLGLEWLEAFHDFEVIVFGSILLLVTIFLPEGLVSLPEKLKGLKKTKTAQPEEP